MYLIDGGIMHFLKYEINYERRFNYIKMYSDNDPECIEKIQQ